MGLKQNATNTPSQVHNFVVSKASFEENIYFWD